MFGLNTTLLVSVGDLFFSLVFYCGFCMKNIMRNLIHSHRCEQEKLKKYSESHKYIHMNSSNKLAESNNSTLNVQNDSLAVVVFILLLSCSRFPLAPETILLQFLLQKHHKRNGKRNLALNKSPRNLLHFGEMCKFWRQMHYAECSINLLVNSEHVTHG